MDKGEPVDIIYLNFQKGWKSLLKEAIKESC